MPHKIPLKQFIKHTVLLSCFASFAFNSTTALAAKDSFSESPSWPKDAWHIEYQYDDFSDKIEQARLIYAPADYTQQAAFFLRCQPYYTNLSVAFLAPKTAIRENGEFHSNAQKFTKHGFVYSQQQTIRLQAEGQSYQSELDLGGQTRGISKWIQPALAKLPADQLQMLFFGSMIFSDIPSFTSEQNTDYSTQLFKALSSAIRNESTLKIQLSMPNNQSREFVINGKRLKQFTPEEVMDFCLLKRQLRED